MPETAIIQQIRSHFDTIIANGRVDFGPDPNAMWLATLDTRTGQYPDAPSDEARPQSHQPMHISGGVNAYWDQPHLVAAWLLSQTTGDLRYRQAVEVYLSDFLARSVAHCGLLLWGNHYYYDALKGETVWFSGRRSSVALETHRYSAWLHELRPISPAWGLLWHINSTVTEHAIRAMADYHIIDPATGSFSHHADQESEDNLLESGAVLIEALAWLYAQTGDNDLRQQALNIARHSFESRNQDTGLLPIASRAQQWHRNVCTTEVGLWAGSLLRAAVYTENAEFADIAQKTVAAWLYYGWDADTEQYFGRLNIMDGTPQRDDFPDVKISPNQPDTHSNIWNNHFPSHDYPLALAEACVRLYEHTGQPEFAEAIDRWATIIQRYTDDSAPTTVRHAGQFGRAIHFLLRASQAFPSSNYRLWAAGLADEATDNLFTHRMFRSNTGEDRYHATDGMGYLLLALLALEADEPLDTMGFGF